MPEGVHRPGYKRPHDYRLEHRCTLRHDCPICEWLREPSPQKVTPRPIPPRGIYPSVTVPLRGLTAFSLLGAKVVKLS